MNIIPQNEHNASILSKKMENFISKYKVGQVLRNSNAYKLKGIAVLSIFITAFCTVFLNTSFYRQTKSRSSRLGFGKDTFYRFMNSCHTNWRKFTRLLGRNIIKETIEPLTSDERKNVLVIDDSLYSRSRSKKVELLARVFDHVNHSYTYGFRLLTMGWSDGNTFLPIDHCLLSSANVSSRMSPSDTRIDSKSNGGKQRKLAQTEAPRVVLAMLKEAKDAGIPANHVLFDTWFCSPSSLVSIKRIGFDVIAMTKKTRTIHYRFNGKKMDVMEIYKKNKKRPGRSKYLLSVEASVESNGERIPVRIVYVRNRSNRKNYLVLVTTDMTLSETEIIRLYGKRWGIEVFFKTCKSYLNLSKECRSISYDAMTAHVAVVFARYMMLAVEKRESIDARSLGKLFYMSMDELADISYLEAVKLVMLYFINKVKEYGLVDDKILDEMARDFMLDLPACWQKCVKRCA